MKTFISIAIVTIIGLLGLLVFLLMNKSTPNPFGGAGEPLIFGKIASSQTWITSGHSRTILAANSGRQYAKCTYANNSTTTAWVAFNDIASKNWGFIVRASQSFEITPDLLYTGAVTGRTTLGSVSFTCLEKYEDYIP